MRFLGGLGFLFLAAPVWADPFEIQVYSAETLKGGAAGVELHVTSIPQQGLYLTAEPHLGLNSFSEIGLYLPTALEGGHWQFAGFRVRYKARIPGRFAHFAFAMNHEIAFGGGSREPSAGFEWEIRPIIDFEFSRITVAVNPIVTVNLSGPEAGLAVFEPAAKAMFNWFWSLKTGVEYYGSLSATPSHRLLLAVEGEREIGPASVEFSVGVGTNLTLANEKFIAKVSVGFDLD